MAAMLDKFNELFPEHILEQMPHKHLNAIYQTNFDLTIKIEKLMSDSLKTPQARAAARLLAKLHLEDLKSIKMIIDNVVLKAK
jgi:hypothetical protein